MHTILPKTKLGTLILPLLFPVVALCVEPYKLTNEWTFKMGAYCDSSAAVGPNGTLYFGSWNGKFWAVNPDGSRKWEFSAKREIKCSPALGRDGTVYFGSRDRSFYAIGADGQKKWEFKTGAWVDSSPAIATDGTVYFGSWDKRLYALGPDGSKRWEFPTGGPVVSSPSVAADGTILFGSHDNKLYALAPSGAKKWEYRTDGPILSSPAIDGERSIYFTSVDGCLYALSANGALHWRLRTGGITESSPVIGSDGAVYVGVNTNLWKVSPEGKKVWERSGDGEIDGSALMLADGTMCFISQHALLIGMDTDRNFTWSFYLYGYGLASPTVNSEGMILLPGWADNSLGLVALRGPATVATTPWPKFRGNLRNTGNAADAVR